MSKQANLVLASAVAGLAALLSAWPGTAVAAQAFNDFLKLPVLADATIGARRQIEQRRTGPDGFTPAPMPDLDRNAPTAATIDSATPRLAPRLFHKQTTYHGEGYVFGSTVQEEQDRRATPAPGINLVMPLQ